MSQRGLFAILVVAVVALALVGAGCLREGQRTTAPAPGASAAPPTGAGGASAFTAGEIAWLHSLPDALAQAKSRNTLVVVDAYADWCGWCKKMDQNTFTNAGVQSRMRDFIPLKIDTDKEPDLARRFGITGLPTTLVLDAAGNVVLNEAGYMEPQGYLKLLDRAAKKRNG